MLQKTSLDSLWIVMNGKAFDFTDYLQEIKEDWMSSKNQEKVIPFENLNKNIIFFNESKYLKIFL